VCAQTWSKNPIQEILMYTRALLRFSVTCFLPIRARSVAYQLTQMCTQHLNHMMIGLAREERVIKKHQTRDEIKEARKENRIAIRSELREQREKVLRRERPRPHDCAYCVCACVCVCVCVYVFHESEARLQFRLQCLVCSHMYACLAVDARKRSEVNRFHMSPVLEKERLEKKFKPYHHVEVHHNQEVKDTTKL